MTVTCHALTGKFLYTANTPNSVSGFLIDPITGALKDIPGSPFAINGHPPEGLYVDNAGKFLYVAGRASGSPFQSSLTGYAIDSETGIPTPIPGMPITSPFSFTRAFFHANGRALYLPGSSGVLRAYSIDPTSGALAPVPGEPYGFGEGYGPVRGAFDPAGTTVFVSFEGGTPTTLGVSAFAVDAATGALTHQGTVTYSAPSPFSSRGRSGNVVVHPNGKYAYVWGVGPFV